MRSIDKVGTRRPIESEAQTLNLKLKEPRPSGTLDVSLCFLYFVVESLATRFCTNSNKPDTCTSLEKLQSFSAFLVETAFCKGNQMQPSLLWIQAERRVF